MLMCCIQYSDVCAQSRGDNNNAEVQSSQTQRGLIFADPTVLAHVKQSIVNGDKTYAKALKQLLSEADSSLSIVPASVMEKKQLPPSNDRHDYMSLARYYWPDTTKPNGLPYTQHDGEVNPEIFSITDYKNFGTMNGAVYTLGLAYYFTGEEKYALHAATLIRTWFLNADTRMNPNLNFAQAIKGLNDGRPTGLIETREIGFVADAANLISGSQAWSEKDQKGLKVWFGNYLDWLLTSPNGIGEAKSLNNHGLWFDVQIASVACFAGREDVARKILEEAKSKRIGRQIQPDGSMPEELARTTSKHYTRFTIEGFVRLATIGDRVGVDLWKYYTKDGRSIQKALDYPIPYILEKKEWTYKQIHEYRWNLFYPLYLQASTVYNDRSVEYEGMLKILSTKATEGNYMHLIIGK